MSIGYRQKVHKEICKELLVNGNIVLGCNALGYLTGYASNPENLKRLLTVKDTRYVVVDNTDEGNLCFDLKEESISSDVDLLPTLREVDYVTKQLLVYSNSNIEFLESELLYNNRLTYRVREYLSENCKSVRSELNVIHLENNYNGRLPIFRTMTIRIRNVEILFTAHQMSFLTSIGLIKVHDSTTNIDAIDLAELISNLFSVNKTEVYNLICMD